MNTKQKIQTFWGRVLQSQSVEEERSNIDEFINFLNKKHLSFRLWYVLENGKKKLLNNIVKPNQKGVLDTVQI
ncbi:MAG: hypothetical protein ACPGTO_11995, partial [Polaribacter sp.]